MRNKLSNILAAVDLGPDTPRIIAYARLLASVANDPDRDAPFLTLLHVMDYALTPPAYLTQYVEEEEAETREKLKTLAGSLRTGGTAADYRIAVGRLIEAFDTFIRGSGPDILVIGHRSHLVRPSSSEKLIKSLDIPMLVVRGEKACEDSPPVKKILCAVDFSEDSRKALNFAGDLARRCGADLMSVHVVSPGKRFLGRPEVCEEDRCRYREERISEAREMLASMSPGGDMTIKTGVPYEEINRLALESNADLVFAGARGMSYSKGLLLGGVSESLIKSSPCPVMVVR